MSLGSICNTLAGYPIVLVKPLGLNADALCRQFPQLGQECFDDSYFHSIHDYNRLMLSEEFYQRFAGYDYILIAQLDTYIFRDELAAWCDKGYDYVGAPWLVRPVYRSSLLRLTSLIKRVWCRLWKLPNSQDTNFKVGNGGLSLRRVESHLKALRQLPDKVDEYLAHNGNHMFNEDVFFGVEVNRHGTLFRYPDYKEALDFSFDKYPALCYRLNGEKLPFGCHSWYKRKMRGFWLPIIMGGKR